MGRRHPRPPTHNLSTEVHISLPPLQQISLTSPSHARWLKSSGLDTPTLSHLKRVRKSPTGTHSTLLLTSTSPTTAPELPPDLDLAAPYQLAVPRSAALTPTSLALKNALWPTVFAPRRKGEPEDWSRARAQWACAAMVRVVEEARAARAAGEVRTCLRLCARAFHAARLAVIFCSLLCLRHAYSYSLSHLTPFYYHLSSFPSRRTSQLRRKSPLGHPTSHATRASPPHTLCATPHSTSCVRSPTRLPLPLPLSSPLPPLHQPRPRQHPRQQRMANITCSRRARSS
jgi:hypothetical protein